MAWRFKALVCQNALDGAPLNWHGIDHLHQSGENRPVTFAATTFIAFRWVVVDAKEAFFCLPSAGVRCLDTFVDVVVAVRASKAIFTATNRLPSVGFYLASCIINTTVSGGRSFGAKEKLVRLLLFKRPGFINLTAESWSFRGSGTREDAGTNERQDDERNSKLHYEVRELPMKKM
jgi:hypothetical protein